LRATYHARCREHLDAHVCQSFQHKLALYDLPAISHDSAIGGCPQLRDMFLEVLLMILEPEVEVLVERRTRAEDVANARAGKPCEKTEIPERSSQRCADFLQ
jgi:hypothetical protein